MYHRYFVAATAGLFFGITLSFKTIFSSQIFIFCLLLCLINFVLCKIFKKKNRLYKTEVSKILICLLIFVCFGILLGQNDKEKSLQRGEAFHRYISADINEKNKAKISFIGEVVDINKSEVSQTLTLRLLNKEDTLLSKEEKSFTTENAPDEPNRDFKIKAVTQNFVTYQIGEILDGEGVVKTENIILPDPSKTNNSFNIKNKNQLEGVDGYVSFPKLSSSTTAIERNRLSVSFFNLKDLFVERIKNNLEISAAALSAGVLLGDDNLFTKESLDNFRSAGLSHIIVLSGFNITILIVFFGIIFSFMSVKYRMSFIILSLITFVLLVGPSASILRASLMGVILLIATSLGRQYVARQALFISVLIMMIANPKVAVYDVSLHLSFLATFGILYILPILDQVKFLKPKSEVLDQEENINSLKKYFFEILKVTLAAQIAVTPYIMYVFGKVSVFGILANIFVIPVVGIIMLLGFLVLVFSFIFLPVAQVIGYLDFIFCKYVYIVAEYFTNFTHSQLTSHISGYTMSILYLTLVIFIYFEEKRKRINFESNT